MLDALRPDGLELAVIGWLKRDIGLGLRPALDCNRPMMMMTETSYKVLKIASHESFLNEINLSHRKSQKKNIVPALYLFNLSSNVWGSCLFAYSIFVLK